MAKHGTVSFTGASGKDYTFTAYSRDTKFNAVGAVYFMTQRHQSSGGGYTHKRIYVGQTGDLSNRPLNHHKTDCFDLHGANCVCILLEGVESKRLKIESDLIEGLDPPCNG